LFTALLPLPPSCATAEAIQEPSSGELSIHAGPASIANAAAVAITMGLIVKLRVDISCLHA
jgi:hypothetical protein